MFRSPLHDSIYIFRRLLWLLEQNELEGARAGKEKLLEVIGVVQERGW